MQGIVLAYHQISPEFGTGFSNTTPKQFARHIRFLRDANYSSMSLMDHVSGRVKNQPAVVITFDDAYSSVYENAFPILEQYGFSATVFPITKFVGGWNQWDYHIRRFRKSHCGWQQLRQLFEAGWEVGSHSVSHAHLHTLSASRLWHELRYSKEVIESKLGEEVRVLSYPFGWANGYVADMTHRAGYRAACTLGLRGPEGPYAIRRKGIYFFEPEKFFELKLQPGACARIDDIKQMLLARLAQSSATLRFLNSV